MANDEQANTGVGAVRALLVSRRHFMAAAAVSSCSTRLHAYRRGGGGGSEAAGSPSSSGVTVIQQGVKKNNGITPPKGPQIHVFQVCCIAPDTTVRASVIKLSFTSMAIHHHCHLSKLTRAAQDKRANLQAGQPRKASHSCHQRPHSFTLQSVAVDVQTSKTGHIFYEMSHSRSSC
jgi:hypothetical protein